jgi:hypothetical protein
MNDSILAPGDGARRLDGPMRKLALLAVMLCAGLLLALVIAPAASAQTAPTTHQAESFTLNPSGAGGAYTIGGVNELYIWSNATATKSVTLDGDIGSITLRARGDLCGTGAPRVEVRVGGQPLHTFSVSSSSYAEYKASATIPQGARNLALVYSNDYRSSSCDRNVHIDWIKFEGTSSGGGGDTTPPDTFIQDLSQSPRCERACFDLAFYSNDSDVAYFEYRLDSGAWTRVNPPQGGGESPVALDNLSAGNHAVDVRAVDISGNVDASPASRSFAAQAASTGGLSLGVYQGAFYNQGATAGMGTEAALIGRSPKVFMWYPNAGAHWPFETAKVNYAFNQHGALPHLTWEWFNVPYTEINSGAHDAYIRQYARDAAAFDKPILMRMFHEMNGNWYSWSLTSDTVADQHKAAWRRIVTIFREEGADNVRFFWCPNSGGAYDSRLVRAWPGDAYVDVVGVDAYNFGGTQGAEQLFRPKYNFFYNTLGSQRPFAIGETGIREATSYPGGKDQWVVDVRNSLTNGSWPRLFHVTLFDDNFNGNTDWRFNSSQGALDAYRAWFADSRYQGSH